MIELTAIINEIKETEKLMGLVSYDTLFTVLTTLFVFLLGVFVQKRIERNKYRKQLKSIKEYFSFLVNVLPNSYIIPQTKTLREFYFTANIDTGICEIPPITISGDLTRLKGLEPNMLFEAYRILNKSDKRENLHIVLSQVDFLLEQKQIIEKYHNSILNYNIELRTEIQNLIENYLDLISDCIRDIKKQNKNYNSDPFWNYINDILMKFYDKKNYKGTISYLYKALLRPVQVELVLKGYDRENIYAEKITLLGKRITTRRYYLRHQTIGIKVQYRQFYKELCQLRDDFNNTEIYNESMKKVIEK